MSKPRVRIPARNVPSAGLTRAEAKALGQAAALYVGGGSYSGARSDKASMKNWHTTSGSADSDTLGDLATLRSRSRDLGRNNPLAVGALATETTNVVGTGLRLRSTVDADLLGITEEAADKFERRAELLFGIWGGSNFCDATLSTNFPGLQDIVFRSALESGDIFPLRRYLPRKGAIAGLALQLIEADRVANPPGIPETERVAAGIERDGDGAAVRAFVRNKHPGDALGTIGADEEYTAIPFYGAKTGERQLLHVYRKLRDGQRRGVPFLAPVIEPLKQLDRFTESELMAAVVSSFFTVFVKTETGEGLGELEGGPGNLGGDIALGPGAVVDLAGNESVEFANPARPNAQFEPFFLAIVKQIGVALEIPYELLLKTFNSSYSASRAAIETAWQHFRTRRAWLASSFCQPVYEWFLSEMVARELLSAPGFFTDPIRRAAWSGAQWIGDARISLSPLDENKADEIAEARGWKTSEEITAEKTGGDWATKHRTRSREVELRRAAGLDAPPAAPVNSATGTAPSAPSPAKETKSEGGEE
ncbi:phage portal protein [Azospirillum sp. TSH64]|uniref:phage portal protein n=1 Tax=Azospirillum sp. TSH64 TaxID=652740 RepID=UPI001304C807|nr:phage portal protein [Azospirillum sp. TSH64]